MSSGELLQRISYEKAYRQNRLGGALWVLEHPETLAELLAYGFKNDEDISYKALWVLEFVCLEDLTLLYPHLDFFFEQLPNAYKHQSLRPLSHICEMLALRYYKKKESLVVDTLSEAHKTVMIECSFDWLITDQKIACQARAMLTLYYLGFEFDWVHPELVQILQQNIHSGSAGYKARGKKILTAIQKHKNKS